LSDTNTLVLINTLAYYRIRRLQIRNVFIVQAPDDYVAMTFSIMTFGRMTFGTMTFGRMTFSRMTFSRMTFSRMTCNRMLLKRMAFRVWHLVDLH
jgi:hypothetical protein